MCRVIDRRKVVQNLDACLAQGYLVLDVVPAGADPDKGGVKSDTAEEQRVRLEQTMFTVAVVGRQHNVSIGRL